MHYNTQHNILKAMEFDAVKCMAMLLVNNNLLESYCFFIVTGIYEIYCLYVKVSFPKYCDLYQETNVYTNY